MKEEKKYSYLKEIKYLSGFAIFLVVLGHALPADLGFSVVEFFPLKFLYRFIYSFHMPLFMSISGYLFIHTTRNQEKFNYKKFVQKKGERLLIPYFFGTLIAFFPKAMLPKYAIRPTVFSLSSFLDSFIYPRQNPIIFYWFLPTLFIIFLIAPGLRRIIIKKKNFFIFTCVTFLLCLLNLYHPRDICLFNISGAMSYLIYFWIGMLIYLNKMPCLYGKSAFGWCLCFLLVMNYCNLKGYFDSFFYLMELLMSFVGILMSFSLISFIKKYEMPSLHIIGKYSYQIFLLHWFIQISVRIGLYQIAVLPYAVVFLIMLAGGIIVPVAISRLVETRIKPMKIILGIR